MTSSLVSRMQPEDTKVPMVDGWSLVAGSLIQSYGT